VYGFCGTGTLLLHLVLNSPCLPKKS
jgi:hypothetical protein